MSSSLGVIALVAGVAAAAVVFWRLFRSRTPPSVAGNGPYTASAARLSYEDSCRKLQSLDLLPPGDLPPLPTGVPQAGDEVLGVQFFRTEVSGVTLESLSLPRSSIGRSLVERSSFRGTDLTESNLCWSDFVEVDFGGASLCSADLRASRFHRVSFADCDLSKADLRRSEFEKCRFQGASVVGAKLTRKGAASLALTSEQLGSVDWQSTEGAEPDGG